MQITPYSDTIDGHGIPRYFTTSSFLAVFPILLQENDLHFVIEQGQYNSYRSRGGTTSEQQCL